jgi:heme/copper-type cytochrome/quinol oxidase subunit 2
MSPLFADLVFWIAAACCSVAQVAVVRSAIRAPMTDHTGAGVAMPRRSAEIVWTIIPAIALLLLLIATWRAMHPQMMHDMPGMPVGHPMTDG